MVDMIKSSRDEDQRKRDEAQFYSLQQQVDELRRQLKENLARQQWFEELYRQNEGKLSQLQISQDRLSQDVAQTLSAREIAEGRMKAQVADMASRVDGPEKQLRDLRAQIQEVLNTMKADREVQANDRKQIEDLQRQSREVNSAIALIGDSQRQLRDLLHELDSAIGEVRQESLHVAELQRMEEHRLRRQGVELQEAFENLRQQFTDVAAKSQRVDDVRRQLVERLEAAEEIVGTIRLSSDQINNDIDRIEKIEAEHYIGQQERIEGVRIQLEEQLSEMRSVNDQRTDRYTGRFAGIDERLRSLEQLLSEIPGRFEALEQRDETITAEADTIEEWLVQQQIVAMETILEQVRKRKSERAETFKAGGLSPRQSARRGPGSIYRPEALIKSVKDAKPPQRKDTLKPDDE